ncbi:MAG: Arsenical resistance operon trans-acting repressor ArsD [Fimbriimonadaceae bacterium]|nr:Arsenical resistance operon trans-acting repressor ArsD [Fimbriimonadaceae bacterium]
MKTLKVYDPAMCCSTGICGPTVDPKLVRLAADIAFLKSCGVQVERFNLGFQPDAFTANPLVILEMGPEGEHLPLFLVDGECKAKGRYPERQELAEWVGIEASARNEMRAAARSSQGCR